MPTYKIEMAHCGAFPNKPGAELAPDPTARLTDYTIIAGGGSLCAPGPSIVVSNSESDSRISDWNKWKDNELAKALTEAPLGR